MNQNFERRLSLTRRSLRRGGVKAVIPIKLEPLASSPGKHVLTFAPLWSRTYVVYDSRKKDITNLYCAFRFGKFAFDGLGSRQVQFSDAGAGCDPSIAEDAEAKLGELISKSASNPAVSTMIRFLQDKWKSLLPLEIEGASKLGSAVDGSHAKAQRSKGGEGGK